MDGRIVGVTEELLREIYHLGENYKAISCNVKSGSVDMELSNGLLSIKCKIPRDIIDGYLNCSITMDDILLQKDSSQAKNDKSESLNDTPEDTVESESVDDEENEDGKEDKEESKPNKKKVISRGKKTPKKKK